MAITRGQNKRSNSPSCFLVASPYAGRTPYGRSVVLLLRSDANGATGILLDSEFRQSFRKLEKRYQRRERSGSAPSGQELQLSLLNWSAGELLQELRQGVWLTTPARREDMTCQDDLWAELVRRIGRSVLRDTLAIKSFPVDPTMN